METWKTYLPLAPVRPRMSCFAFREARQTRQASRQAGRKRSRGGVGRGGWEGGTMSILQPVRLTLCLQSAAGAPCPLLPSCLPACLVCHLIHPSTHPSIPPLKPFPFLCCAVICLLCYLTSCYEMKKSREEGSRPVKVNLVTHYLQGQGQGRTECTAHNTKNRGTERDENRRRDRHSYSLIRRSLCLRC